LTIAVAAKRTVKGIWTRSRDDRISANGAGVAFFFVLALFPGMAAAVALYSVLSSPADMLATIKALEDVVPQPAGQILKQQTERLVNQGGSMMQSGSTVGWVTGVGLFIWSANKGTKGLLDALNVVFDQVERRGFIRFTLYSLAATVAAVLFIALTVATFVFVPLADELALGSAAPLIDMIRWPLFFLIAAGAFGLTYRLGPTRRNSLWTGSLVGGAVAALAWIISSFALSWYFAMVADLGLVYGSLTGMIALMIWAWLSAVSVLLGAEVDAHVQSRMGAQA
jgi:membrane protein